MARHFGLLYGLAFLLIGLVGLAQHGLASSRTDLLGIFPINGLHNFVHLLIGAAGIGVFLAGARAARTYARVVGLVYTLVGILGLISPSGFGPIAIGGADVILYLAAGTIALFFGFSMPGPEPAVFAPVTPRTRGRE